MLSCLAVAAWNGHQDRNIADRLRRDGVEVDAQLVEYRSRTRGGSDAAIGDEVKVAFRLPDGHPVEAWAVTGVARDLGPTRVRYLRSDPSVVRLVTDLEPRSGGLTSLVIMFSVFGLIGWGIYAFLREMQRAVPSVGTGTANVELASPPRIRPRWGRTSTDPSGWDLQGRIHIARPDSLSVVVHHTTRPGSKSHHHPGFALGGDVQRTIPSGLVTSNVESGSSFALHWGRWSRW